MKQVRIGGQAVIEGVMMKNGDAYAVAVRKPDNDIEVKLEHYTSLGNRIKFFKLPIIRGVVNFIESLVIGIKTLTFSAEFFEDEEEEGQRKDEKEHSDGLSGFEIFCTVAFSLIFAILLFMLMPAFVTELLGRVVKSRIFLSIFEGVLRLGVFLAYVVIISCMEDIKRVFMYHGAEHKSINCLEAGVALTPENVKEHSRYHKRCGTSFLFIVMIISIFAFMFINFKTMWLRILGRLILIPVIAGVSYEFIMFAGKSDSKIANILSAPGLWVQRLTTKEPDLDMIEVAIKSVEAVLDWRAYQDAMNKGELEK